jgi:type IV secretory pathway TraG/TraD family ATPase VirD4
MSEKPALRYKYPRHILAVAAPGSPKGALVIMPALLKSEGKTTPSPQENSEENHKS